MAQVIIRSYKNGFKNFKEVALADNIFFAAFGRWSGEEVGLNIIKALLPADEEKALNICLNGVTIDNMEYIAYTSTPNMQKKEKGIEKCEMWFIKKDKADFIPYFEDLISLGTIKQFENKKICINKKVTSRVALAMSSTYKIDFIPRIAIVPNKEIQILQDVIYYIYKDKNIIEHKVDNKPITLTQHDGFGLMNQTCADAIKSSLNLNYSVDFAIIRLYGLAVKGLVLNFDWMDYVDKYCKGKCIVEDIYGDNVDLRNIDIILTETQAKWWENFEDMTDFNTKLDSCKDKDLVECLYVTKTNKKKTKEFTLANYQLLNNLSLDFNDFMELSKPTVDLYKKVLDGDLPAIKYFLREFENEEGELIPQQKIEYLLNAKDNFIRSSMVKQTLSKAVLKSVAQLSSGKFYLKGNYKIVCGNPFLLIDNLLGIDRTTLKANEFYIPKNNNKQFTISRNPLASPWEIINIKTADNTLFNKYFKHYTDEIIFFNNLDWSHCQTSYSDEDGDGVTCIENSIIYNNVISDNRKFLHVSEGETKEMEYTTENKFLALIKSSGNLIGNLAINGSKISNTCLRGTKKDIIDNFYKNRYKLLYLAEIEMCVIDSPKTLKLPTTEEMSVLDLKHKKPLFLKYKDGYYEAHKTNKSNLSYYEQFSKKIIDELLVRCVDDLKNKGTDLICNYIYTPDVIVDDKCLKAINDFVQEASRERRKAKNNLDEYKYITLKYQLKVHDLFKTYKHSQICNCLVKISAPDKIIVDFFFEEIKIKFEEMDLTAKVLRPFENGQYEFFGRKYKLVDTKLIEDNLHYQDIQKGKSKFEKKGKTGIIGVGLCDFNKLIGECTVDINLTFKDDISLINLYKEGIDDDDVEKTERTKITYAFKDIKDEDGKKTNDTLFECNTINVVKVIKTTDKSMRVKIEY